MHACQGRARAGGGEEDTLKPGSVARGRTLVVEAVNAVDAGAFVVAPEDEKVLRVLDLVGKEEADRLHALLASVDVVAQEQVVRLGREAAILEQAQQVVVLAVNVA